MTIAAHQALFGELNRSHSTIAHSGVPQPLLADLEGQTDLPVNAPTGVPWGPYLTGSQIGEHYVLGRTAPDPEAARPGMVLTHTLIMKCAEIAQVGDLTLLTKSLPEHPTRSDGLSQIQLAPVSAESEPQDSSRPSPRTFLLARALIDQGGDNPVAWLGNDGFAEALAVIWRNLRPALRPLFTFRLSFRPDLTASARFS